MTAQTPPPRRPFPVLRQWYAKLAYIIIGITVFYVGGGLAPTDNSRGILRSVLLVVIFYLATRIFRSAAEPDDELRPWWRMTGLALAGWVLGVLFALVALAFFAAAIGISTTPAAREVRSGVPVIAVSAVLFAGMGILYLTSSIRLRGAERAARVAAQRNES